jgi:DNA-directed RNA polymerase specialized sigma24 family protein
VSRGRRISAAFRGLVRVRATEGPTYTDFTPETSYLQHEGRERLVRALADVGPDARAALLLSSEGFSGAEIAATIGRTEAATRTLLCRSRVQVRRRLETTEASR